MGDPYRVSPGLGGMTAYSPKAMAVVCILMEAEKTYRKMVGHSSMHQDIISRIGLPRTPSKNTIWRAYGMIPESYLYVIHKKIVSGIEAGSLAGDSTGCSNSGTVRWYSIHHDQSLTKRGWVKLHSIIDIAARVILDYRITDGYASDITSMWPMPNRLEDSSAEGNFFCLDSAYLARRMCDVIFGKGWLPRIKPKSSTTCSNGGSPAWGEMTRLFRDDKERFLIEYHMRSIIESVFGALKKMHGSSLRSRSFERQSRDLAIRIILYNIDVVTRVQVTEGRHTAKSLAAMAA